MDGKIYVLSNLMDLRDKKMKILQITPYFKPMWEAGGVVRVAYDVSKQLSEWGHEVTIYTTNRCLSPTEIVPNVLVDVDGIKVYYFENLRKYFPRIDLPVIPYYLPFIAKKEIQNFDIIHIHDHRSLLAVIVCHYARKYDVPFIIQAHGSLPYSVGNNKMKKLFDVILGKKMLEDATKVIALNLTEADCYRNLGVSEDKIEILPNGVDLSEYMTILDSGVFRKKYKINKDQKILLYVGRLDPTKGIDLLIRSFVDLLSTDNNVQLVLLGGDVGHQDVLENIVESLNIKDKVIFTGFVSKEDKMAAYVDADVFVTPSFTGFPMTFLEACFCGTPIVTTDKGDFLDWINDEVGFVVKYNQEELAEAILRILRDEGLRTRFSERGQELVQCRYNWGAIVREVEEIYLNCNNH